MLLSQVPVNLRDTSVSIYMHEKEASTTIWYKMPIQKIITIVKCSLKYNCTKFFFIDFIANYNLFDGHWMIEENSQLCKIDLQFCEVSKGEWEEYLQSLGLSSVGWMEGCRLIDWVQKSMQRQTTQI